MSDDLFAGKTWCPHTDSNRGPTDYKSVALPALTSATRSKETDKEIRDTNQVDNGLILKKHRSKTDVPMFNLCSLLSTTLSLKDAASVNGRYEEGSSFYGLWTPIN